MLAVPVDAADPLLLLSQVASSRRLFAGSVFRIAIQYGTLGNSTRGAFRGPGLWSVDLAANKRVPLRASARLELRIEVFNIFNRANFGNPTLIAFAGAAANEAPLASFGRIRSTVTSARQLQLGARLTF